MAEPVFPTALRDSLGANKRRRGQAATEAQERDGRVTVGWRRSTDCVEVV